MFPDKKKGRLLFYMKLAIFGLPLACRRGYCRGGSWFFLANWYACCQHHLDRICMVRRNHNGVKNFIKSNHILYATIIQQIFECPKSKLATHCFICNLSKWYFDHRTISQWDNRPSNPAYYIEGCQISNTS